MNSKSRGFSANTEYILMVGAILASMIFFMSFYNLTVYQTKEVYDASEHGFVNELKSKIETVSSFSAGTDIELSYDTPVNEYELTILNNRLSVKYPKQKLKYVILDQDTANVKIDNSDIICIHKNRKDGKIYIAEGKCVHTCDLTDEHCDEGCVYFNIYDPKCCSGDSDSTCLKAFGNNLNHTI